MKKIEKHTYYKVAFENHYHLHCVNTWLSYNQ